jgi:uncharacterized glyoxalase superfamily protein PhnB
MTDDLVKRLRTTRWQTRLEAEAADRIEALEAEVGRMREALKFYEDPWGYQEAKGLTWRSDDYRMPPDFYRELDFGDVAHAALKLKEKRDA